MVSKWSVGIDKKICGVYHDSNSQTLDGDRQAIVPAKSEREGIDCLSQNPGFANRRIDGDEQTVRSSSTSTDDPCPKRVRDFDSG